MIIDAVERRYLAETHDAASGDRARAYLDKILQLNVPLREPDQRRAVDYLAGFFSRGTVDEYRGGDGGDGAGDEWFEPVDQGELRWQRHIAKRPPEDNFQIRLVEDTADELAAFDALRDHLPANPRELKRLLNVHRLVRLLARQSGWCPGPAERRLMVGWLLLCFTRPSDADAVVAAARADPDGVADHEALADFMTGTDDADAAPLPNARLLPGAPLGEAWAITALFSRHTATRG